MATNHCIYTIIIVGARGIRMVAIGTELGVWMGIEGDTNNLRRVLTVDDVTQIGVLEEYHIFLVLAGKKINLIIIIY